MVNVRFTPLTWSETVILAGAENFFDCLGTTEDA
jgi:hypothetical protein